MTTIRNIDPIAAEEAFRGKLREAGLIPPDGIRADGKIVRIDVDGKKPGNRTGFYVYHGDGIPAGAYGAWSDQPSSADGWQTWCAFDVKELSQDEYLEHKRRLDSARAARAEEEKQRRKEAQERAGAIWGASKECGPHPYLERKGVRAYGVRENDGCIIIPIRDRDGVLHSIERIDAEGNKRFLSGGRKAGCWFELGEPGDVLCIAEGYATAASIYEATGYYTAVAFDCGSLPAVAKTLRDMHPTAKIIVCEDDDQKTNGNPGAAAAGKAAKESGALVAVPDLQNGGDFNDQHALKGLESVADTIAEALASDFGPIEAKDLFPLVYSEIVGRKSGKKKTSLSFGIKAVDAILSLNRSEITVVAGLPGAGKTAAALGIIRHNTIHGVPCLIFSIEMDRIGIGVRCISHDSDIPAFDIFRDADPAKQNDAQRTETKNLLSAVMDSSSRLSSLPLTVDDRPVSFSQIVEYSHKWMATKVKARGHVLGLIVIDYLGLIKSEEKSMNRNREVAAMMTGLKSEVCKALRTPVMVLSQLSREAARRGGEPEVSDLRDSGEIEAAADNIIFPYLWPRDDGGKMIETPDSGTPCDKWLIRKNKNGPKGAVEVKWNEKTMLYSGINDGVDERLKEMGNQQHPRPNWQDSNERDGR